MRRGILEQDKSIIISLLYVDLVLYEPTYACLVHCVSRIAKGSVVCIDELNFENFPGETQAVYDFFRLPEMRIERVPFVPNIGVIRL